MPEELPVPPPPPKESKDKPKRERVVDLTTISEGRGASSTASTQPDERPTMPSLLDQVRGKTPNVKDLNEIPILKRRIDKRYNELLARIKKNPDHYGKLVEYLDAPDSAFEQMLKLVIHMLEA